RCRIVAEAPPGGERSQVEPIEERPIPVRRGTKAAQINSVSNLQDGRTSRTEHGGTRVAVPILLFAVPQFAWLAPACVEHPRARGSSIPIVLREQDRSCIGPARA